MYWAISISLWVKFMYFEESLWENGAMMFSKLDAKISRYAEVLASNLRFLIFLIYGFTNSFTFDKILSSNSARSFSRCFRSTRKAAFSSSRLRDFALNSFSLFFQSTFRFLPSGDIRKGVDALFCPRNHVNSQIHSPRVFLTVK